MKITVIHGQSHKGSTYLVAEKLLANLNGQVKEFFLPRDFHEFCKGCTSCILIHENTCPHDEALKPLVEAILEADLVILTSPVYCMHCSGAMKSFLDHLGYLWMPHRPKSEMFTKQAVTITTAAGAGMKSAGKDMKDSLVFWGIPHIYSCSFAVQAAKPQDIPPKIMQKIDKKTSRLAEKILHRSGKERPGLKTKGLFGLMRVMQKQGANPADQEYWQKMGWMDQARPWKQ